MPGSTHSTIRSSLAVLLDQVQARVVLPAVLPLAMAVLAISATVDLARRPFLTVLWLVLAFIFYFLAARRLEHVVSAPAILVVASVLRILLLPLPPTLSDDTLRYVWDGKVVRSGLNPYLLAPEATELEPLRDDLWAKMPHQQVQTVYPPLAMALFTAASALPYPLLSVKLLLTGVELIGCWLLIAAARRLGLRDGRAIWYCWNPLVCLEVAGMGHVDAMVVTAAIATVFFLLPGSRRPLSAAATAAAGVLSKLVPLVALPIWARQSGRPAAFMAVALSLVILASLPIAVSAGGVPPGLVTYGVSWEFNGPIYEPLWRAFDWLNLDDVVKLGLDELKQLTDRHEFWNRFYPYVYPQLLAKLLLAGAFVVLFVRGLGKRHLVLGCGSIFGSLILCAATVYPWYLLWMLPWAALARHRAWLVLSALMPLSYLPQHSSVPLFPWVYLAIWAPFFFLLAFSKQEWSID